jgi:hypothetical protein
MQASDITNAQSRAFAVYNAFRKPAESRQKRKKMIVYMSTYTRDGKISEGAD